MKTIKIETITQGSFEIACDEDKIIQTANVLEASTFVISFTVTNLTDIKDFKQQEYFGVVGFKKWSQ